MDTLRSPNPASSPSILQRAFRVKAKKVSEEGKDMGYNVAFALIML